MQVNALTNETMREIIQALLSQRPEPPQVIQQEQTIIQASKPCTQYQPNTKIKIKPVVKAIAITHSDICFVSSRIDKILLPYHGRLPDELLLMIFNEAIENCFTIREIQQIQQRGSWGFESVISDFVPAIGLKPSKQKPLIALQLDATTVNGHTISKSFLADAKMRQVVDLMSRFFNRRKTGLRADICACLERQHVEYKRKFFPTI